MFKILYFIWLLLPLGLLLMAGWAMIKPYVGAQGRESVKEPLKQVLFCSIAFVLAVAIDQTEWFEQAVAAASFAYLDIRVARWLLYPGILLAFAYIQRYLKKENGKRTLPRKFIYN